MAALAKFVGTGQPGRAGADDGDPLAGRRPGVKNLMPFADAASVANRCNRPICTGDRNSVLSTQAPSQSTSVGQARAQEPPKMLASRIVLAAPISFLCMICRMNFGTSMCVGQARVQGASKQYRQRVGFDQRLVRRQRRRHIGEPLLQHLETVSLTRPGHDSTPRK